MNTFNFKSVLVKENCFIGERIKINETISIKNVYKRFKETGRFDALKCRKQDKKSDVYWDSDIAKWLEGAAIILSHKKDDELHAYYDEAINDIIANQLDSGYFNSYFQVYEPEAIFTRRMDHELYCAGHLFEAAVTTDQYLSDKRLLVFAEKYCRYIKKRFIELKDVSFVTPGHEEIELALYKLYLHTGQSLYKEMADFFLENRSRHFEKDCGVEFGPTEQFQSHLPIREQTEAVGHAVRALYLYCAMADKALIDKDEALKDTLQTLFEDIITKKSYVTGGVGSVHRTESFTYAYDLDNLRGYSETCASIAMMLFADRMFRLTGDVKYGHIFERVLYNAYLAGVSLDGKSFFYVNPLQMDLNKVRFNEKQKYGESLPIPERVECFSCSCCPPNVCRFFGELSNYIWYYNDKTLTISQYISSSLRSELADCDLESGFPYDGKIKLKINSKGQKINLRLRKPEWCKKNFENECNGYLLYEGVFDGKEIVIDFQMDLRVFWANPEIENDINKVCFVYGPLVLCAEGKDNKQLSRIRVCTDNAYKVNVSEGIFKINISGGMVGEQKELYFENKPLFEFVPVILIPYFSWGNRGANDMKVWLPVLY